MSAYRIAFFKQLKRGTGKRDRQLNFDDRSINLSKTSGGVPLGGTLDGILTDKASCPVFTIFIAFSIGQQIDDCQSNP